DVAVIGEPTSLRVVHAQRGIAWSRIITKGVAAHGSAPERGANAILHMTEVIRHLDHMKDRVSAALWRRTVSSDTFGDDP
ncbi:MAG TPA: peptidase dimerization domain-containing protein, partial [Actinomycetota bacterium]|nr:peptidase dimerization domain-containing protein [Actinomycetota bacterium]